MASRRGLWPADLPQRIFSRRAVLQSIITTPLALQKRAVAKPNIILIVANDMRADDLEAMPAVRSLLAAEGASFTNFVVAAPVCSPARVSILRGQYPHNHGVLRGKGEMGGFPRFQELGLDQSTVATWLHDAGYRTGLIGTYLPSYRPMPYGGKRADVPLGWDEWIAIVRSDYNHSVLNENGRILRYAQHHYSTDFFAARAIDFVTRSTTSDQPFFLFLAPQAPHAPAVPAPRHAAAFADIASPRPPSFNERAVADKPRWVKGKLPMSTQRIAELDALHADRWRTLLAIDEMVAALIGTLAEVEALATTFISFTSDNGYHLGEHRVAMERESPYEEAIRVPLVVRGPGVPAGTTIPALASQIDLAPTFAALADAALPAFVDGRSLVPLLERGAWPRRWRQAVLSEHLADRPKHSALPPGFATLRAENLSYVEYTTGERELYDLVADRFQLENLAAIADPSLLEVLSRQLSALRQCDGETCRAAEDQPLPDFVSVFSAFTPDVTNVTPTVSNSRP